jgi:EAL domain-containing protein (putative c-di-GMP-specific phosphodiesterase class I)
LEYRYRFRIANKDGYKILIFQQAIVPVAELNNTNYKPTFYELLARLQTPDGIMNAGKWIDSVARDNELMHKLDMYMLEAAAKLAAKTGFKYTVNVGNVTLRQPYIFQTIAQDICFPNCDTKSIALEVSERDVLQSQEQMILKDLSGNHVVFLDDVGAKRTNHASLSYVTEPWVGGIKLDRDFVNKLRGETSDRSLSLIGMIFSFCANSNLYCVCEGVEDKSMWETLLKLKRDRLNGWGGLFVQGWGVAMEEAIEV